MRSAADARDAIALLQTASLPSLVQEEILRLLRAGQLAAGAKLSEVALATRLGVSRGPVREAFRALEESGLVRREKNRGVFVREMNAAEAAELYALRAGLDELAARLLAPTITDAQIAELRTRVDRLDRVAGGIDAYFPLNLAFHDRIVEMTGNGKLLAAYRRLIDEMHLLRRHGLVHGGGLGVSNAEHRAIVEALARRDAGAATRAAREHVLAGRRRLVAAGAPAVCAGT
jgi:phosphonate utilization transcriptional regulator